MLFAAEPNFVWRVTILRHRASRRDQPQLSFRAIVNCRSKPVGFAPFRARHEKSFYLAIGTIHPLPVAKHGGLILVLRVSQRSLCLHYPARPNMDFLTARKKFYSASVLRHFCVPKGIRRRKDRP